MFANKKIPFNFSHVGSFVLLFFLSVIQPASLWSDISFSFAPITLVVGGIILVYKIHLSIGFLNFWKRFKVSLVLLSMFYAVMAFSLVLNFERYKDLSQFVEWGATFFVIQMWIPIVAFLFLLPQSQRGLSFTNWKFSESTLLLIALLVPLVAIWQRIDFASASLIHQFFIASNLGDLINYRSIFAISTDLGAISAIVVVFLVCYLTHVDKNNSYWLFTLILVLLVLYLVTGVISGSRNFLLTIVTASIFYFFVISKRTPIDKILFVFILFFSAHVFVYFSPPEVAYKFRNLAPYLFQLKYHNCIALNELQLNLGMSLFGERSLIWESAIHQIRENFWFGITNGGFRLTDNVVQHVNTHNFLLQVLIDSGVVGFTIFTLLIIHLIRLGAKTSNITYVLTISIAIVTTLLVDYFPDHSLPWIVITAFLVSSLVNNIETQSPTMNVLHTRYVVYLFWVTFALFAAMLIHYQYMSGCLI